MKLLHIIFVTFLLSTNTFAQKANYKVFPFKKGIIKYNIEGNSNGTHIKYIDEYGYKQADFTETLTTVLGFSNKENKGVILIGPKVYSINYTTNTASTSVNPVYETYANSEGANYDAIGRESMSALGFSNSGETEIIAGKKCEIWQGSLGKIWIWKSLALKTQTTVLGININEIATSVNIDTSVPSSKFEIPSSIKVEDMQLMDDQVMGDGDYSIPGGDVNLSEEDKHYIKKINNLSYSEFRKMVMKEDPEMSEEEIKLAYKMSKEMAKYVK